MMDNKERLDLLNSSYQKLISSSNTIGHCSQQTDDLLHRLQEIKQKLVKGDTNNVADDFKEIHETHIQNTQYIEKLELYEKESMCFAHKMERICGKTSLSDADPIWFQHLKKRYLNKAILYELYREGRFKAAELFAEESKLKEVKQDKDKFIQLHSILRALDRFDIDPALKWIADNEETDNKEDDDHNKDINFATKYCLYKYSDILRFLLHRDKFLHISAIGTKQEMYNYMRSELEKLRNTTYKQQYAQEIINNLHFEASSIAYYVDDWKLLYHLKMFPHKTLNEIPVQISAESLEKYTNAIEKCQPKPQPEINPQNINPQNINPQNINPQNTINRKRKNTHNVSPRKKRKISSHCYNVCYLCPQNRDYLNEDEKLAIFESFEFPELIDSVWNLARKSFINAFINMELNLPNISGLQSCLELSWNVFPKFKALSDDICGDFDDTLTLFKDFNKEQPVPFVAHHNQSDEDNAPAPAPANGSLANHSALLIKWDDYDTLNEDDDDDDEEEDDDDEKKEEHEMHMDQKKGRFRIQDNDDDDDDYTYNYGDYNDNDTMIQEEEQLSMNGYIGYINRKEFNLEMKKKQIIRRSKNKEYKDRVDKYGTAEFIYHQIQPFVEAHKKKRSKNKLIPLASTIILANRSRALRYDSRVQRPHSLSSSHRHRSHRYHSQSASPTNAQTSLSHLRIRSNTIATAAVTTPPPPSDSDAAAAAAAIYNTVISHSRRSHQRRLYQNLVHRSIQQQFSPPPINQLLAPRIVNENENQANNEDLDFQGDLSAMLNPSIFASRSSSPLSSQLTGITLEQLSMTNNTNNNNEKVAEDDDIAAQALLLLKNKGITVKQVEEKENDDDDDDETMQRICIDWENVSDSSEDQDRYLTQKDKDVVKNDKERLKISSKMGVDFVIPNGYLAHSIFVCPIQTDYVADPQAKLGCGHLISYNAFVRLQNMQRQRQHQENRNRNLKIHCPNCDQQSDVDKDIRYVYLGRFPNLRMDSRFADILDKKDLDQNTTKWIPGATQINGQE